MVEKFDTEKYNRVEDNLLEYVIAVADRFSPDFVFDPAGEAYAVESQAPNLFKRRYNDRKLNVYFKYSDYIKTDSNDNDSVINIVRTLGIDVEKFWYLLLFISDYVVGSTLETYDSLPSPKEEIERLIDFVEANEESVTPIGGVKYKQPMNLTLQVKGHRMVIDNPDTISAIAAICKQCIPDIEPTSRLNFGKMKPAVKSDSIRILLFGRMLRTFFELYPQFSGQRRHCNATTKSTLRLISKLAYLTKQTTNEDYNTSDENLKALLKQYRNHQIDTINSIYG